MPSWSISAGISARTFCGSSSIAEIGKFCPDSADCSRRAFTSMRVVRKISADTIAARPDWANPCVQRHDPRPAPIDEFAYRLAEPPSQPACESTALGTFIVTPPPSRWLALEPTHADKQFAKRGDIGEVPTELCARWKEKRA